MQLEVLESLGRLAPRMHQFVPIGGIVLLSLWDQRYLLNRLKVAVVEEILLKKKSLVSQDRLMSTAQLQVEF